MFSASHYATLSLSKDDKPPSVAQARGSLGAPIATPSAPQMDVSPEGTTVASAGSYTPTKGREAGGAILGGTSRAGAQSPGRPHRHHPHRPCDRRDF